MDHLSRAIEICGSQAELARRIGGNVVQQHVWNWVNRANGRVPPEQCIAVENATEGKVTRYDLRPDVFGSADASQQAAQSAPHREQMRG